jgi:predicted phage terminase large subunit-like protein
MGFVDTLDAVREMLRRYPETQYIYVEDKANGSAIIDALVREFTGVVPVSPEGGKHSRAAAVSYLIEAGKVWLPKYESWVEDFLKEAGAFPAGKHDDQVDATSQALNRLSIINAELVPPKKRKYVRYTNDMWEDLNNATPELELELLKLWG